jgi:hypothetical protein
MHGEEFFRLVFEHMRRPQRPVNARTVVLEFGSETAVDYVDGVER